MYEPITLERLKYYTEIVKELDYLLNQKTNLSKKIGLLQGIDYSKIKVTSGNGNKISEEELYAMTLQKINSRIDEIKCWLTHEHEIIKTQIARVKKWNYRKILVLRYLEKWKWSEIISEFFSFEEDYEEEKGDKYKFKILYWNRQAIQELEKVSTKPFIKKIEQLNFEIKDKTNA